MTDQQPTARILLTHHLYLPLHPPACITTCTFLFTLLPASPLEPSLHPPASITTCTFLNTLLPASLHESPHEPSLYPPASITACTFLSTLLPASPHAPSLHPPAYITTCTFLCTLLPASPHVPSFTPSCLHHRLYLPLHPREYLQPPTLVFLPPTAAIRSPFLSKSCSSVVWPLLSR